MAYLQSNAKSQLSLAEEDTLEVSNDTILKSSGEIYLGEMTYDNKEIRRN